jgi:hypothetical protein
MYNHTDIQGGYEPHLTDIQGGYQPSSTDIQGGNEAPSTDIQGGFMKRVGALALTLLLGFVVNTLPTLTRTDIQGGG